MIEPELNKKISQKLEIFENLENINPSDEWNSVLMERLENIKPYKSPVFLPSKFILAVLIIVVLNIGIVLAALFTDSKHSLSRDKTLEIIQKEMLVNPNLFNN